MLGWILLILGICAGLGLLIMMCRSNDCGLGITIFVVILAIEGLIVGVSYQYHIVNTQYRYGCYKQVVEDTKDIIDKNRYLNFKDMEMGKQLTEVIIGMRKFEMEIQSCKASPFSVFKPRIEIGG